MLCSHTKNIESEGATTNRNVEDVNESLYSWIKRDYLRYQRGPDGQMQWAEWDLIEALLLQLNPLFHESFFGLPEKPSARGNAPPPDQFFTQNPIEIE